MRFLAEELDPDAIRDQEVLRSLTSWRTDPDGMHFRGARLSTILCTNAELSAIFEHFAALVLTGQDIRRLASATFAEALFLQGVKANSDSVAGFIPLWRRAIRQPIDQQTHVRWVQNEISNALPKSLRFANDLYYYWRANSQADVDRKGIRSGLRSQIVKRAMEIFDGKPSEFIRAMDPDYMYTSYHFCVLFSSPREGGTGFTAADWHWFAGLLLNAGEIAPRAVVPQIVCFLIEEQNRIKDYSYSFNEDFAKDLFGNDMLRLMRILATNISVESFNLRETKRIRLAQEVASQWLRDNDG